MNDKEKYKQLFIYISCDAFGRPPLCKLSRLFMKEKLIFIDTFALSQFMKECAESFINYLLLNKYNIVFTSLQLVELYNPKPELDTRTSDMIILFSKVPFTIIDQKDIINREEYLYPNKLKNIPIRINSKKLFENISLDKINILLNKLFTIGLPENGIPLTEWVQNYSVAKNTWKDDIARIIENAKSTNIIANKDKFVQSIDLRLCNNIVRIKKEMDSGKDISTISKFWIKKLSHMFNNGNTKIMRGIHLSSLVIWYDYIIAKKKIHGSDIGDIYYAILFPYCKKSIVDNSRYDCLMKIKRHETDFYDINVYNKSEFMKLL